MTIGKVSPTLYPPTVGGGYTHGNAGPGSAAHQPPTPPSMPKRPSSPSPRRSSSEQSLREKYDANLISSRRQSSFAHNKASLETLPPHVELLSPDDQEKFQDNLAIVNSLLPDRHGEMDGDAFASLKTAVDILADLNSQCEARLCRLVEIADTAAKIFAPASQSNGNANVVRQFDSIELFSRALDDALKAVIPAERPASPHAVPDSEASQSSQLSNNGASPFVVNATSGPLEIYPQHSRESLNRLVHEWRADVKNKRNRTTHEFDELSNHESGSNALSGEEAIIFAESQHMNDNSPAIDNSALGQSNFASPQSDVKSTNDDATSIFTMDTYHTGYTHSGTTSSGQSFDENSDQDRIDLSRFIAESNGDVLLNLNAIDYENSGSAISTESPMKTGRIEQRQLSISTMRSIESVPNNVMRNAGFQYGNRRAQKARRDATQLTRNHSGSTVAPSGTTRPVTTFPRRPRPVNSHNLPDIDSDSSTSRSSNKESKRRNFWSKIVKTIRRD